MEKTRDELYEELKLHNIFGCQYSYPLISQLPTYRGLTSTEPNNLSVATKAAEQVICLPIYPGLNEIEIQNISNIIR